MNKTPEGFLGMPETWFHFFAICVRLNLDTEEERGRLLRAFVKHDRFKYIPHPAEYLKNKRLGIIKP